VIVGNIDGGWSRPYPAVPADARLSGLSQSRAVYAVQAALVPVDYVCGFTKLSYHPVVARLADG
jgi:hypothetical protein